MTSRPQSYDDWKAWALEEDRKSGADVWKTEEACNLYDSKVIRGRYDELVDIRRSGDAHRLVDEGERATWPKIEIIRNCTELSRCIDETLRRLEAEHPRRA